MDKETPRNKVRLRESLLSYTCTDFRKFSSYDFLGKCTYFYETKVNICEYYRLKLNIYTSTQ